MTWCLLSSSVGLSLYCCMAICSGTVLASSRDSDRQPVHWSTSQSTQSVIRSSETLELVDSSSDMLDNVLVRDDDLELSVGSDRSLGLFLRQAANDGMSTDNKSLTLWNCSKLYDSSYGYNYSSCKFVKDNCQSKVHLMDYLAFMKCDLPPSATVSSKSNSELFNYYHISLPI